MYSYLLTIDVLINFWHGGTTLRFILGGSDDQYNASEIKLYSEGILRQLCTNSPNFADTERQVAWKCVLAYNYQTTCVWEGVRPYWKCLEDVVSYS